MKSSDQQTASAIIMAREGRFFGLLVTPDGTNNITITVYDNASAASGKKLVTDLVIAGNGGSQMWGPPIEPVDCANGIYVDMSVAGGGTGKYVAYHEEGY